MFQHPPPHLHPLHRPPTAPSTPDTEHSAHNWPNNPNFPHLAQGLQPTNLPPYILDRRQPFGGYSTNGADGFRPSASHTPQIASAQSTTPGPGASGPLLPQNLAQHLNNPPPPTTSQHINAAVAAQAASAPHVPTPGGKVLLMPNGALPPAGSEEEKIYVLITELLDPDTREGALLELSKKRELYEDLALVLWGGFGIMSSLLLEIVAVYPALSPPSLTAHASNRVCNALALLQCVASHPDTRALFLNAHIPLFLYPFLNTTSKTRPFEYLRLTSLGVIGALVKQNDNSDVINFLLSTEIIPLCLRIMETGSELSKTVAIFIVQKILADDLGLQYICQTYERFYAVGTVLANMVDALVESQAVRLLKHVVRCYLRMSDNSRAREALRACLPKALQDNTFNPLLKGDLVTKRCLSTLLMNLNSPGPTPDHQ
ncbi:cell differentiation protein rcd1 [Cryptococcus amylolentus CBS 6273]|uniref:Cell differentiation protein rcd1 n=1 Tax=Cryptococcus amylolentus CBS 6273 TaxID=1296118 RepID=A0A1E3KF36_9TREE|nr:cell differentiation protein rcd1 [Cryptococcus amylolentus CBS 6273]